MAQQLAALLGVARRILEHLERWAPELVERAPGGAAEWLANALVPLRYHPLPDIA